MYVTEIIKIYVGGKYYYSVFKVTGYSNILLEFTQRS